MRLIFCLFLLSCSLPCIASTGEPGLLFHLSGDREFAADYAAGGDPQPTYLRDVKIIPDGASGRGFECAGTQLMSYRAPGNIYAERGTLAFSWRSREPVGPTPFPIFRVGYADHSSWDMVWLRIDYNGRGGFDAFVTDINLARIRVSYALPAFPKPDEWVHLALAWDETRGIRFYVNGVLAAKQDARAVLYAGLDQFGPHSRIISPYQVQSAYNFVRGGDIDEIRIYDRMLSDENVASVAKGVAPREVAALGRDLSKPEWRDEWWVRYGWNRKGDAPPILAAERTAVRKVEIHDVYDIKRWWWKATDGIRETTWPGVYNRSRLAGRNDYFQLPDWDCYSLSGKSVTFTMPEEPWNHLEISGAAWGKMSLEGDRAESALFRRPKSQEKTFHRLPSPIRGRKIRFENVEQEEPIGELSAYNVGPGSEPQGTARLAYTLRAANAEPHDGSLEPVAKFIAGRHTAEERSTMTAVAGDNALARSGAAHQTFTALQMQAGGTLPLVHILIPAGGWQSESGGLDGIGIDLPPLRVKPTHGAYFPLNVQVKDPLWLQRNLLDFSFSVSPGQARTLWLDTRDRILPPGKALYIAIAGASSDFNAASLEGARVRLIFKSRAQAVKQHELDRFTQARDSYAMLVEERPNNPRLNLYNRFAADVTDLLRVSPNHWLGQAYWYDIDKTHPKPAFMQPAAPDGVPLWAFRQVEQLGNLKRFVLWYVDRRQIGNGEFGGGLSDDGDLTNTWPGTALMGSEPEKIKESLSRQMEAFYEQGLFTNGLSTIQTDELHSYEEGIQVLGQSLLLDYGNPKQLERAMETSRALINLTAINGAGHRHIRSTYFSGTRMAEEEPWGWSKPHSYLAFHPSALLVEYNGNPRMKKIITELADGLLAHRKKDASGKYTLNATVKFQTDEDKPPAQGRVWPIFWAAWRWTGDAKYLQPYRDEGPQSLSTIPSNALDEMGVRQTWADAIKTAASKPESSNYAALHLAWQVTGDKRFLESLYAAQIEASALREYINTEGSLWIDRVAVPEAELQRARLGGVALTRNSIYPGQAVSWKFQAPAGDESVAILIPNATGDALKVIAYNLSGSWVKANMTAWGLEPGRWEIMQGIDSDGDDSADGITSTSTTELERAGEVALTFQPRATTILNLKLISKGTPYHERPDLGIGKDDVVVQGGNITVTVHSLGAADSPPTELALLDKTGKVISSIRIPALKAPADLLPKTVTLTLSVPARSRMAGASVVIDRE
ncbi:MAG: LamG domain-containing protein, partial [Rubrivivax sp.]|nr:LamG domain-containing protein [Pyrinomonadaceae bacterium]